MKRKNMKNALAAAVSAAMVMSMPMGALASSPGTSTPGTGNSAEVEAPIYSFDVVNVVVPTSLVVAFNPDELEVTTDSTATPPTTSTDQVLSQNFGILNKSNKDKIVTVTLKVEDLNNDKITFVDTDDAAKDAAEGEYAVHLAVVPADTTEVKVGTASADDTTDAAAIAKVEMTKAADSAAVTLAAGNNTLAFVLQKATYEPASGGGITLGSGSNDVTSNLELTAVATGGKGITAFTFTGALNQKAEWSQLTNGIKITAVYDFETTYDYAALTDTTDGSIVSGTGAMISEAAPKFTTGDVGVINFTAGLGDGAFASLVSVSAPWDGQPFDLTTYAAADADAGTIVVDPAILGGWADKSEDPTATIVYKNAEDQEVTVTVTLKTH